MEENKKKESKNVEVEEVQEAKKRDDSLQSEGEGQDNSKDSEVLSTEAELIARLEKEKAELHDKWLRTAAEFENFRRRTLAEKSDWIKNANQRIILELCDVNDNFERAFESEGSSPDKESYKKGIAMIHKQLDNILKREGVEKIESVNKEFDPAYHEALAHIPSEKDENVITAVIQNGYLMNGKVIRAAQVAVSNGEKPKHTGSSEHVKPKKKKKK